jgi:predicted phosphodiesterase
MRDAMALYGVIADIHGNREALAAALAALEQRRVERIVCLGNVVGYNADPDECVAMVRELGRDSVHFVNPGAIDASRKHSHKRAECALFDTRDWSIEFLRVPYDCAATEAKAAVFGYRIPPLTDRLYSLRRRLAAKL